MPRSNVEDYLTFNDSYVKFNYPFWFALNKTSDIQILNLKKGDVDFTVWKVPTEGKTFSEYVDIVTNRSFGRQNYTAGLNETIKNGNGLTWYITCGDSVGGNGAKMHECFGITQCSYFYIVQLTASKGEYFQKQVFDRAIESFICFKG